MRLGMNTVILGSVDLDTALGCVAYAGYENVELAAIIGMCEHVSLGDDPERIQDLLTKHHLTATAMEAATTDKTRLRDLFKLAHDIGVPIVNIGSGGTTDDEASTVVAIDRIRELARMAGDADVLLAVKPHVGQAIYNAATGMRLMNEVNDASVGLNFDPSHLARANEDPAKVAPLWGEKIITSHFRDCPTTVPGPPGTPEQQIPGRGALNLPGILGALKGIGYDGPLNLEIIGAQAYELPRSVSIAAESRGYLHRCLQEI